MGFFGSLFSSKSNTFDESDEAIRAYFKAKEKLAWKWPSKEWWKAMGVYLDGNLLYEATVKGRYYSKRVELPDLVDHKKVAELCHAAMDPANIRAAQKKFKNRNDPTGAMRLYLAVISPDEEERDRYRRELVLKNEYLAYYIYKNRLVERYCNSAEDKMKLYYLISKSHPTVNEQEGGYPTGPDRWIRRQLLYWDSCETRRQNGLAELKKMLHSRDPKVKAATAQYLKIQMEKEKQKKAQMEAEYYALYEFAQDELEMQLVDENGKKIKLRNGKVTEVKD